MKYTLIVLMFILVFTAGGRAESDIQAEAADETTALALPEQTEPVDGIKAAAPFRHSVKITRTGSIMKLDYQLIGADGKTYDLRELTNSDYSKTPTIAIYKGDLQVASGQFEYG